MPPRSALDKQLALLAKSKQIQDPDVQRATMTKAFINLYAFLETLYRDTLAAKSSVPTAERAAVLDPREVQWRDLARMAERHGILTAEGRDYVLSVNRYRNDEAHGRASSLTMPQAERFGRFVEMSFSRCSPAARAPAPPKARPAPVRPAPPVRAPRPAPVRTTPTRPVTPAPASRPPAPTFRQPAPASRERSGSWLPWLAAAALIFALWRWLGADPPRPLFDVVVTAERLNVRRGPSASGAPLGQLLGDTRLGVFETGGSGTPNGPWYRVDYRGSDGWVSSRHVRRGDRPGPSSDRSNRAPTPIRPVPERAAPSPPVAARAEPLPRAPARRPAPSTPSRSAARSAPSPRETSAPTQPQAELPRREPAPRVRPEVASAFEEYQSKRAHCYRLIRDTRAAEDYPLAECARDLHDLGDGLLRMDPRGAHVQTIVADRRALGAHY